MPQITEKKRISKGTKDTQSCARLLDLRQAAEYLGLSYWTLRDYVQDGILPAVKLPCARRRAKGGAVIRRAGDVNARRIFVDRSDLDMLVERSKESFDI